MKKPLSLQETNEEVKKIEDQIQANQDAISRITMDELVKKSPEEIEPQTKLSTREKQAFPALRLKPVKTVSRGYDPKANKWEQFNEAFRKDYDFKRQLVRFTAENYEIIGDSICIWTKPFPGMESEYWEVPVNTVVEGPRYLAEQIKRKCYRVFTMREDKITPQNMTAQDGMGAYYGRIQIETSKHRIDAHPVSDSVSVFMNAV